MGIRDWQDVGDGFLTRRSSKSEVGRRLIIAALFLLCCAGCGGPTRISASYHGAYEASLIPTRDGFAVAWYDDRDGNAEIYFRLLDRNGQPSGPERRITSDPEQSYEADIQSIGDRLAIAWYDKSPGAKGTAKTASGALHAKLGVWTRDGQPVWSTAMSGGGRNARNPIVRATGTRLFCAWIEDSDAGVPGVWAAWWDAAGHAIAPPRWLAPAGRTTWNLNGAIASNNDNGDDEAWVVFDATAGTRADELFSVVDRLAERASPPADPSADESPGVTDRRGGSSAFAEASADKSGPPAVMRLTADDGKSSKYPDIVFGGDRVGLTWFDERDGNQEVYFWAGARNEMRDGLEQHATRVTTTPGESIGAYVSWNEGRFGLAWNDNSQRQHEIFFEPFDARGRSLAAPIQLTHTITASLIPSIRPAASGFALAWNEALLVPMGHDLPGRSEIEFIEVP